MSERFQWPVYAAQALDELPSPVEQQEQDAIVEAAEILESARRESQHLVAEARGEVERARAERKRVLQHTRHRGAQYLESARRSAREERGRILSGLEDDVAACVRRAIELALGREPATSDDELRKIVRRLLAEAGEGAVAYVSTGRGATAGCPEDPGLAPDGVRVVRADGAEWSTTPASRFSQVQNALKELGA